ncbi:hypothetical protein O6P37_25595 [Mycobacterium sp. CPCC 205372]|uniref:Uncharacterized protein n=1 Tax=Mycobacterium hippophais TaxID=3016340 RepID=A0ABT4Q088_9MYCO|nr:hypothetical protein [Mycobacterium hippophais]MCZ8382249.1 hypothetical protein [Mycobacterium hippophais]
MDVWSSADIAFWAGFGVVAIGMVGGAFLSTRRERRRAYWICWLAGGVLMALAAGHDDAHRGLTIAGFCVVMSVITAIFRSPHIKIGGIIFAASRDDRQPDPPEDQQPPR